MSEEDSEAKRYPAERAAPFENIQSTLDIVKWIPKDDPRYPQILASTTQEVTLISRSFLTGSHARRQLLNAGSVANFRAEYCLPTVGRG
jgi:hypothetical protein